MAQIDLATYVAKVEVDDSKVVSGLGNIDNKVQGSASNIGKQSNLAATAFKVAMAGAVAKVSKEVVTIGSEFGSTMSEVQAISGATGGDLERLSDKAKEMGRNTKFSASEAGEGLKYMAMAGWDTNSMIEGLDGVMMLAAASGEDLAMVSDIVTDALSGFGMEAHQASEFADLLASTSSNSNTNVAMLGESFKYVAPLAGSLGYTAEDTALALGLMANAGIKGSQAGTTLRNIMTGLATPTKESADSMSALGLEVTNADGSMRPFKDVLVDMREKFDELTPAQKAQHAQAIAGKQGMAGLLAIMSASPEEFEKLVDSTTDYNGVAEEMSEIMEDNLQGDLNKLNSAVEGLAIDIYELLVPAFRGLVQVVTESVEILEGIIELLEVQFSAAFTLINEQVQEFIEENEERITAGLENVSESFSGLRTSWIKTFNSIRDATVENVDLIGEIFLTLTDTVSLSVDSIGLILEGLGLAVELLAPIFLGLLDVVTTVMNGLHKAINGAVKIIIDTVREWVNDNKKELQELQDAVKKVTDAIKKIIDLALKIIKQATDKHMDSIKTIIKTVLDIIVKIVTSALDVVADIINFIMNVIEGDWKGAWDNIKNIVKTIWDLIKSVVSNGLKLVINVLKGAIGTMLSVAKQLFGKILEAAKDIFVKLITWLPSQVAKIFKAFTSRFSEARSAGKGMFSAVWDGMKGIWSSVAGWVSSKVSWLTDKLAFWRRGKNEMNEGGGGGTAPRFAVGTPLITKDTPAILHKGEAVIPASLNPFNPRNTSVGGFWNGKFGKGQNEGSSYNVNINIDKVESDVDIEKAVKEGIDKAERARESRLKKRGL